MAEQVILVTGFEPWGRWDRNPSGEIAEEMTGASIGGCRIVTGVLPVVFEADVAAIQSLIQEHDPAAVVSLGLGFGPALRMERVALNLRSADGGEVRVLKEGPDAYFSTLPVEAMVARSRESGVPAVVSHYAGDFNCNHVMYRVRHLVEERVRTAGPESRIPSGFIHVPPLPEQVAEQKDPAPSLDKCLIKKGVEAAVGAVPGALWNLDGPSGV